MVYNLYIVLVASFVGVCSGQAVSMSRAFLTPRSMTSFTYSTGGGQASAIASDGKNTIVCESPATPSGTAIVCSKQMPKNITGAISLHSSVYGESWCLKATNNKNIILSSDCSGTYRWYVDEAQNLRPISSTSCAASSPDKKTSFFNGNVYLAQKQEICSDVVSKWVFEGQQIKKQDNPELCLTVCVSAKDGCNTIPL
eukprot:TRINITY_DN5860_c1_g1_i3.p2 TRINITY_DN5860_c1_g1~~TRINITY_DN5860_c1_g1_i3.p2  ORF type:complete len:198 (-),score=29.71 TRINITY_DN5860_c1_g1_i3:50-643(-)